MVTRKSHFKSDIPGINESSILGVVTDGQMPTAARQDLQITLPAEVLTHFCRTKQRILYLGKE